LSSRSNINQIIDFKVDDMMVIDGDMADTKFESMGAEANGAGDDLLTISDEFRTL
jgi:hypothetical protein